MARTPKWLMRSVVLMTIGALSAVGLSRPVAVANDAAAADAVAKTEAWIKAHSKESEGYRVLAHVHALAWAYGEKIPVVGNSGPSTLPHFTEDSTVLVSRTGPREGLWMSEVVPAGDRQDRPVTAEEAKHLAAAIAAYRKAIELDSGDALSELGLGWLLAQQGVYARELPADYWEDSKVTETEKATWGERIKQLSAEDPNIREAASKALLEAMPRCAALLREVKSEDPETTARIDGVWRDFFDLQALGHYRKAFELRADTDLKGDPTYQVDSQVSARAGAQILAVLGRHPQAAKKGESKAVTDVLEPLKKKWEKLRWDG